MADAVQLVAPPEVGVLLARSQDLDEAVQVAVRSLGLRDEVDRGVGHARHLGVGRASELPTDGLEPLVDVGVKERERRPEIRPSAS